MMISKRLLFLAGYVLILAACTEDTTTAPPVAADVGVEAIALTPGLEAGTITLARNRKTGECVVKVALSNLFDDPAASDDGYFLLFSPGYTLAKVEGVPMQPTSRGTFRGTMYRTVDVSSSTSYNVRLGYWTGSGYYGEPLPNIATVVGLTINVVDQDFTFVNRCF